MAKVKNVGERGYTDGVLHIAPGEVVEVPEAQADYLCSNDSPGEFERVAAKPAKKDEK